ncbi:MAG: dioxygenase, partial [Rhizobacter sp.]
PVHVADDSGLDHGIWTALRYLWPDADVAVLPLAFVPTRPPAEQFRFGEALAALRAQGVLVLGTGSITHNLRRVFGAGLRPDADQREVPESRAFRDWFAQRSTALDWEALFDYRRRAPHAADMHPTDEHLLPWYVAAGAGGRDNVPLRLHDSATYGAIGMDLYAFGPEAGTLAAAAS